MRFLKHSTQVVVHLGPFVDATDGFTAEVALAPVAGEVELFKSGSTLASDIYDRSWTHIGDGIYRVTLTTGDTDTAGPMSICAHVTGARPAWHEFNVLAATAYDAMVSGSPIQADMVRINGNATAATLLTFSALTIANFTIGSGSSTTRLATNLTDATNDHWNGRTVLLVSGTMAKQAATITDYNGATKELIVSGFTSAPVAGDIAVIV